MDPWSSRDSKRDRVHGIISELEIDLIPGQNGEADQPRLLPPSYDPRPTLSNDTLMTSDKPSIINVHTPSSSIALVHSSKVVFPRTGPGSLSALVSNDTLTSLFDKLSRKSNTEFHGKRVGPGWLKYEWNTSVWNLDDGTI